MAYFIIDFLEFEVILCRILTHFSVGWLNAPTTRAPSDGLFWLFQAFILTVFSAFQTCKPLMQNRLLNLFAGSAFSKRLFYLKRYDVLTPSYSIVKVLNLFLKIGRILKQGFNSAYVNVIHWGNAPPKEWSILHII